MELPFDEDSNIYYLVKDLDELQADSYKMLSKIIDHFTNNQLPRLKVLDKYSKGENESVFNRQRSGEDKANNHIAHNFGKLIAQFVAGYTTSVPIKYTADDKKQQDFLEQFNADNDVASLDNELMYDVAKYGRAFEIQYKVDNIERIKQSDVFNTFMIYDTSIDRNPVAGVRIVAGSFDSDTSAQKQTVYLYTDSEIVVFQPASSGATNLTVANKQKHFYGKIPIVEYQSNRYRTSWYEDVISLIDAYDSAASDTSNYMQDLVNSILVISGDFAIDSNDEDSGMSKILRTLKDYNMLQLQSGYDPEGKQTALDAKYISPDYDSNASETYKDRIRKDIFTISNIPDMSDEHFSGNSSGVSMRYKIFGFEQAIAQTTNAFKRALNVRYEILFSLKEKLSNNEKFGNVGAIFTANLPYAVTEEVAMLTDAGVPISRKTMYDQTHFTDSETEEANLKAEGFDEKEEDQSVIKTDADKPSLGKDDE